MANSAAISHSPSFLTGHQSKDSTPVRIVSSPWTQMDRGSKSEPLCPLSSDSSLSMTDMSVSPLSFDLSPNDSGMESSDSSKADRKPAWNKPIIIGAVDHGPVMDAVSLLLFPNVARMESSDSSKADRKPAWNKPIIIGAGAVDDGPVMDAVSFLHSPNDSGMESSDSSKADRKPAWNKPIIVGAGAVEDGHVMDAVLWPALSLSTKPPSKSGSSDSLKVVYDGLVPKFQIVKNNANANSTPDDLAPLSQNLDHGGEHSSGTIIDDDSFLQPLPLKQGLVGVEVSPNAGNLGSPVVEASSSRENTHHMESGQRVGLGSQSNSEQHQNQNRGSFRKGSSGSNHYQHNHVGRRDQERGNRDWNRNRSFNGRDSRGYVRAPPHDAPFIPPTPRPLRPPYGNPMVYQAPVVYPMPPHLMFFPAPIPVPVPEPLVHSKIVNQIDYYFSYDNLVKDTFLRQNMDQLGWVPIKLIASFKKVRLLTDNIQLILGVLHSSSVVEVQGDKVRKRNDWWKWTMQQQPSSVQFPVNMQKFRVEENSRVAGGGRVDGRTSVLNRGF